MMRNRGLLALMMVVVLMLAVPMALAQDKLDETYVSDDGTFTFDYPSTWDFEVDKDGVATIWNDTTTVFIYPPAVVEGWDWGTDDPAEMLDGITAMWEEEGDEVGRVREIEVNGAPAAVATYINEGYPGTFTVFTLSDGSLSATDAVGNEGEKEVPDSDAATALAMTESVALVGGSSSSSSGGLLSSMELDNYDAEYGDVIEELRGLDLIGSGGSLLFIEDYAWFEGFGNFYTPLARDKNFRNFVMSGELQYTSSNAAEYEECTLGYHVVWSGNSTSAFGNVGLANENYLFYIDVNNDGDVAGESLDVDDKDLNDRHVFTLIVVDGELTLFVNGQLAFEKAEVEDRAGSWGVGLRGAGSTAKCEARNVWVYTLP